MLTFYLLYNKVEVTKYEELEEVHAELKLKHALWNSLVDWDVAYQDWIDVSIEKNG